MMGQTWREEAGMMGQSGVSLEVGQVWSDGVIERTIVAQVRKRDDWVVKARIIGNPAPVKDVGCLPGWLFEQGRCGKLVEATDA